MACTPSRERLPSLTRASDAAVCGRGGAMGAGMHCSCTPCGHSKHPPDANIQLTVGKGFGHERMSWFLCCIQCQPTFAAPSCCIRSNSLS